MFALSYFLVYLHGIVEIFVIQMLENEFGSTKDVFDQSDLWIPDCFA